MKSYVAAALAATVAASPLATRQSTNIDPTVLQFALTLEHLENVFYKQALQKFSSQDFVNAGFSSDYYSKLQYIASDEESHVKLLTGALQAAGANPVAACNYKFPYTDPKSFVTLSSVIEGVGTSAYLGGAPLITSKDYLTVAGSILVTEALHTSYQRNAVGEVPFANAYGTPLDPTSVYSIAAAFIGQCPSGNAPLPFVPFPSLTYVPAGSSKRDWQPWYATTSAAPAKATTMAPAPVKTTSMAPAPAKPSTWAAAPSQPAKSMPMGPSAGSKVSFTVEKAPASGSYVTFISGLVITSVPATINGNTVSATIPSGVSGQTYVFLSSSDQEKTFSDKAVLAGPAIIEVTPPAPSIDFGYYKN